MSLDKLLNKVATQGQDQSVASTGGGGDYSPPEKGVTGARLVGYFEVGTHEFEYQQQKKTQNEVQLVFELIGKKHPPREVNGEKIPTRITVKTNLSTNEKAWFYKWFSILRNDEKQFVQLIGKPLLLEIEHTEKERGGKKVVYANVKKDSIRKARVMVPSDPSDPSSELVERDYPVGPALTELKAFVWEFADADMWDSIYIPGEYPARKDEKTGKVISEARSKNIIQEKIATALNFKGLPIHAYAVSKLSGDGAVDKAGVDALEDAVGDVANAKEEAPPFDLDDPMSGVA